MKMQNLNKILSLFFVLTISNIAFSAPVSVEKAQIVAFNFIKNVDSNVNSSSMLSLVYTRESAFYVFGHANSFVIIAADDRVTPIFGYSTESTFVVPTSEADTIIGNNFWGWMKSLEDQVAYVAENNIAATDAIDTQWITLITDQPSTRNTTTVVTPLLTTTWNQTWPYNALCPVDASGPGGHVLTGCVATAMAQILKYHNYPSQGLGSYGYTWGSYPPTSANFGATTYNWSNMPNSITTENTEIATLIYQTAVSCRSMWGAGETGVGYSGGQDPMSRAFINYFKMAYSTISFVGKGDDAEWNVLIQGELLANRPVYYRGDGVGSHAWVCDGVDASNMYHFNFGWGGMYNGYYTLSSINPGSYNFTNNQQAIIGIKPNDGSTLVTNTTWTGTSTKSTNIAVPDAITLTVSPGATINFAPGCKLQIFGRLLSTGTASNYTKFTASNTSSGWEGIKWDNFYMNKEVMADNDSSKLIYTQVEYSQSSGIYCKGFGKVLINHCKINNNYTEFWGGGISVWYTAINITNSELYNNHATIRGGGFFIDGDLVSYGTISQNDIHDNLADASGGGIFLGNVNLTVDNNIIHHNQAGAGAGIGMMFGGPTLVNNKICNNTTPFPGYGALYIESANANIVDNLIANNTACGIYVKNSSPNIINSTIVNNYYNHTAGMVFDEGSDANVKNCIVYGNEVTNPAYGIQIQIWDNNSDPYFDHCDIQGGIGGFGGPGSGTNYTTGNYTNNIDLLPQFVAPSAGASAGYDGLTANWQLQSSSPCINAGDITGISTLLPALDLAGNPRINGVIDMGAYEYVCVPVPVSVSIAVSENPVCANTSVTFTATPTNGGTSPTYQWKKNGSNVGNNAATYAYIPVNGDVITCVLTSNLTCVTGNPATSNAITMTVNTSLPVSIAIVADNNSVCSGTTVTYTATPTNGGTSPTYQWKKNGVNVGTNSPTYSVIPSNGEVISCVLTSNLTCTTGNPATSNAITMSVNTSLPVSVSIIASQNPVCPNTSVTFTATPTNGGTSPTYQWKKNGANVGTNSPTYSVIPVNGEVFTCVLTSNVNCTTGNPATSNPITMTVNTILPVSVSIAVSENPVCANTSVTFTATPTNGGTSPTYQWKKNGANVGTNSPTYSVVPLNADVITCVLTSNLTCTTGNPAMSNAITMVVTTSLPVSVSIVADNNAVCAGTTVTYTATPTNGGTSPTYQWKKNGVNVGTNASTYSVVPLNADVITCVLTSNLTCTTGNPASSNPITMSVNTILPVSVSIAVSENPVCANTSVTFTATPSNGGTSPSYQWKKNGSNVGNNAATYAYIPVHGDVITCVLTSNFTCTTGNPATSNAITMTVNALPIANAGSDQSINYGMSTTLNGSASGGSGNYSYHWEPAAMLVNANVQNPVTINLISSVLFTLTVTDVSSGCTNTDQVLITVTGGPLAVTASATPNTICAGENAQLNALVSGGTGNYTYNWTSNPAGFTSTLQNPVVSPNLTTTYMVAVYDGNATVSDQTQVAVYYVPEQSSLPVGPDTIDLYYVTTSDYSTSPVANTDYYTWILDPPTMGTISGNGTNITITWSGSLGEATLSVKAINSCGEGLVSEPLSIHVDNSVGVDVITQADVSIYPNPTDGKFTVSAGKQILNINLFDVYGRLAKQQNPNGSESITMDCSEFSKGIYFVHVSFTSGTVIRKLVVR